VLSSLKRTDKEESEEGIATSSLAASQDSLWSQEDDSFPGMETGNDLMWLDKVRKKLKADSDWLIGQKGFKVMQLFY